MESEMTGRKKASHVGAPAIFALELECKHLNAAFGGHGCYLVGSAAERPDWRDVDVVQILEDDAFAALFPDAGPGAVFEFDLRWLILTTSISERLSRITGLPIDFKFQSRTWANERHTGPRSALGLNFVKDPA
jgi:hypothetical protein